jgi:tRNA U34 5-carboxymethylaminomethyl modifying enzyme MnmG/GidA
MKKFYLPLILILYTNICISEDNFDVVVVGGTAAGVGAAVAAARDGKSVAVITRVSNLDEIGGSSSKC